MPLLAIVFAAVLVEGVMQIAAYAIWRNQRQPVAAAAGKTVLCIGDSWTHGMGSSDPQTNSYPARLEKLLHTAGATDWNVVNGGRSGQNSRDVLERLPSQLAQYTPRIVCVLVGQNDYWSNPERLAANEQATFDHSAYRFRWRLPRLLRWAIGNLRGVGAEPVQAVRDPAQWQTRQVPDPPDPYRTERGFGTWTPEIGKLKDEGWSCMGRRDLAGAQARFEQALALSPEDAQCHQALAGLHRQAGRKEQEAAAMQWLRNAWRERGDYWTGRALTSALEEAGQWRECLDLAKTLLDRFPEQGELWRQRAWCEFQLGELDAAMPSIDRAIALRFNRWSYFTRYKIHWVGRQDLAEGARTMFACYVIDNDASGLTETLRAIATPETIDRLHELARTYECPEDVRARIVAQVEDVRRSLDGRKATDTLVAHLERIVVMVRNAGATPILMDYPWWNEAEGALHEVAAEHGVPFVAQHAAFEAQHARDPAAQLRASDGHCNDAGYQLMAGFLHEQLLPLVQATGR